jgi:hypothetical protein
VIPTRAPSPRARTASAPPAPERSCDDGNVCDGAETCDPATGCKPGTALVCNDGDACTTDGCDTSSGCTIAPFTGFELPKCRLTAAIGVVATAPGVAANIRNKVLKKLGIVDTKLGAAGASGLPVKKVRKALKIAGKQLGAATKLVTKQAREEDSGRLGRRHAVRAVAAAGVDRRASRPDARRVGGPTRRRSEPQSNDRLISGAVLR